MLLKLLMSLAIVSESQQCDWPSSSGCDLTPEKARKILEENPTLVYLTFDDGPDEGTPAVLDALKKFGVRVSECGHNFGLIT